MKYKELLEFSKKHSSSEKDLRLFLKLGLSPDIQLFVWPLAMDYGWVRNNIDSN